MSENPTQPEPRCPSAFQLSLLLFSWISLSKKWSSCDFELRLEWLDGLKIYSQNFETSCLYRLVAEESSAKIKLHLCWWSTANICSSCFHLAFSLINELSLQKDWSNIHLLKMSFCIYWLILMPMDIWGCSLIHSDGLQEKTKTVDNNAQKDFATRANWMWTFALFKGCNYS